MAIKQLAAAESGWRAVFAEPDGSESLSRIVGWAVDGDAVVGLIVDPSAPAKIVSAAGASSPSGGKFSRYRFVPEKPAPASAAAPAAKAPADDERTPEPEDAAKQFVKSVIKRRR